MNQQGNPEGFAYWRDRMHEPALTVLLVVEFLLIFVVIPLNGMPVYRTRSLQVPIVSIAMSLAAIGTVATIARGRLALLLTVLAASIAIVADLFRYEAPSELSTSTFLFAVLAFLFILPFPCRRSLATRTAVFRHFSMTGGISMRQACDKAQVFSVPFFERFRGVSQRGLKRAEMEGDDRRGSRLVKH